MTFNLPCPECGKEREYVSKESLERAALLQSTCYSCRTIRNNKKRKGTALKGDNPSWKGYKDVPGKTYSKLRRDAQTRDIAFEITIEDIQNKYEMQEKKCALTGLAIEFGVNASVDRIDSLKDYTPDNIQIVVNVVNMMKRDIPEYLFITLCTLISRISNASYRLH